MEVMGKEKWWSIACKKDLRYLRSSQKPLEGVFFSDLQCSWKPLRNTDWPSCSLCHEGQVGIFQRLGMATLLSKVNRLDLNRCSCKITLSVVWTNTISIQHHHINSFVLVNCNWLMGLYIWVFWLAENWKPPHVGFATCPGSPQTEVCLQSDEALQVEFIAQPTNWSLKCQNSKTTMISMNIDDYLHAVLQNTKMILRTLIRTLEPLNKRNPKQNTPTLRLRSALRSAARGWTSRSFAQPWTWRRPLLRSVKNEGGKHKGERKQRKA